MSWANSIFMAVFAIAVAYPIAMRFINRLAEPSRMAMARIGRELLASPNLTERQKEIVDGMLDDAFNWRFMIAACIVIPMCVIARVCGAKFKSPLDDVPDRETAHDLDRFVLHYVAAVAAANPLFASLALAEFLLLALPIAIVRKLTNKNSALGWMAKKIIIASENQLKPTNGWSQA